MNIGPILQLGISIFREFEFLTVEYENGWVRHIQNQAFIDRANTPTDRQNNYICKFNSPAKDAQFRKRLMPTSVQIDVQ